MVFDWIDWQGVRPAEPGWRGVHAAPLQQTIPCRSAKYLFGGPRGGDERYG